MGLVADERKENELLALKICKSKTSVSEQAKDEIKLLETINQFRTKEGTGTPGTLTSSSCRAIVPKLTPYEKLLLRKQNEQLQLTQQEDIASDEEEDVETLDDENLAKLLAVPKEEIQQQQPSASTSSA